jgi:hypothetical protein
MLNASLPESAGCLLSPSLLERGVSKLNEDYSSWNGAILTAIKNPEIEDLKPAKESGL